MAQLNPSIEGDWTLLPNAPPQACYGQQRKKLWRLTISVSQKDSDYIKSQKGFLKAPGLGAHGHEFTLKGVQGRDGDAVVEPPGGAQ